MLPLYLAGAAVLGVGAYLFTHQKKIPPAVAQAAIQPPPPAPTPVASKVITPNSPEAQAAAQAAQVAADMAVAQAMAEQAGLAAAAQFPGTGLVPRTSIESATQFDPAPGPGTGSPEVAAAAQAASDLLSSGALASPADQAQSVFDVLNQFTNPNE